MNKPLTAATVEEAGAVPAPNVAAFSAKVAIAEARRRAQMHCRQASDARTSLIETADIICNAVRKMTEDEQKRVWVQAVAEGVIANRKELQHPVAALVEIALQDSLKASSLSQFRAVLRHALAKGISVASLAGTDSVWSVYKTLRHPRAQESPPCRLTIDPEFAARAVAEGVPLWLKATPTGGYELVAWEAVDVGRPGSLVIDGTAEAVAELPMVNVDMTNEQCV